MECQHRWDQSESINVRKFGEVSSFILTSNLISAVRCYYTDVERGVLVFEDLNVGKFVHVDKTKGFDTEHMTMCVKWMAKWHAATAVLLLKVSHTSKLKFNGSPRMNE